MSTKTAPARERGVSYTAEAYLMYMLMFLRSDEGIPAVAPQTRELLGAVQDSLEGCRWELLQAAYDTLGRLIDRFEA